jgi:hypothetical protein
MGERRKEDGKGRICSGRIEGNSWIVRYVVGDDIGSAIVRGIYRETYLGMWRRRRGYVDGMRIGPLAVVE